MTRSQQLEATSFHVPTFLCRSQEKQTRCLISLFLRVFFLHADDKQIKSNLLRKNGDSCDIVDGSLMCSNRVLTVPPSK